MFVSHILPLSRCHDRPDMGDRWGKIAKTQIAQNIQILHLYVILESLNPIYAATSAAPVNVQATTRTRSTQNQLAGATSVVYISLYLSLQTSQLATKCSGLLWSRFLWVRPLHLSHARDRHRGILPVRRHILRQVRLLNIFLLSSFHFIFDLLLVWQLALPYFWGFRFQFWPAWPFLRSPSGELCSGRGDCECGECK